ncbi:MAG: sugar ABC transporter permease [Oscillospiraceae bacterium]|nr:sugar ABC transporter permease [Oscillospiraceae bacterium]
MLEKKKEKTFIHNKGVKVKSKEDITTVNALTYGKWPTKISAFISGFGNLVYGQTMKGIIFLASQIFLWYLFFSFGWQYLKDVNTLGTQEMGKVFSEKHQIWVNVPGDNSLKILLFSIFAIAILAVCFVFQMASVKSSYVAEQDMSRGKKPSDFERDVHNIFDKNLHTSMLSLPAAGVIAFTLLPIIFMVLLAFTNFDRSHQPPGNLFTWVGFDNFKEAFNFNGYKGQTFFGILGWTIIWAIFATFGNYLFGMLIALMINKKDIKLKSLWRTCLVIAIAVPGFVTLLFMRQMLSDFGPVNVFLKMIGLPTVRFLKEVGAARVTVIMVNYWIGIPYTMLITSGILMNIPADLYESARIDGAGPVRQFWSITLPYMLAVTTPYLITQFIANINNFNAIYFLTAGEPLSLDYYNAGKTDLLITWLYKLTVRFGDYNLASVIGIVVFVICGSVSLATFNITASAEKEETFK